MRSTFVLLLLAVVSTFSTDDARATWVPDGAPLCTGEHSSLGAAIASDGAGGAIVAWIDNRNEIILLGDYDIYVQRVDPWGTPLWTANGVPVCTVAGNQDDLDIASDGFGGVIVTWQDFRSGENSIYAQRVDATGAALWTTDGVAVCTAAGAQFDMTLVSDGAGGAIVTWEDARISFGESDVYAQRVDASGIPQWTVDGVALCTATRAQGSPSIVSDGVGGAIVTWDDSRSSSTSRDIYVQRVNATGIPLWTVDGVPLCMAAGGQNYARIVADGAGGAIVSWYDPRISGSEADVYAQRVGASGIPQWTVDGVALCTAPSSVDLPITICSDDAGGAIVTWADERNSPLTNTYDIYAQRVDASGIPQWTVNGVALCTEANSQRYPRITSDGAGGAIVTWSDSRNGITGTHFIGVYTQRVNASGIPQWTGDGVALCTNPGGQAGHVISSDGDGGAIVAWSDSRGSDSYGPDVYAQRVNNGVVLTAADKSPDLGALTVRDNYPDPFSVSSTLEFELGSPSMVTVDIYDVRGRRVAVAFHGEMGTGWQRVVLDGDNSGKRLASGVYFYRVRANGATVTRKMVIAR